MTAPLVTTSLPTTPTVAPEARLLTDNAPVDTRALNAVKPEKLFAFTVMISAAAVEVAMLRIFNVSKPVTSGATNAILSPPAVAPPSRTPSIVKDNVSLPKPPLIASEPLNVSDAAVGVTVPAAV